MTLCKMKMVELFFHTQVTNKEVTLATIFPILACEARYISVKIPIFFLWKILTHTCSHSVLNGGRLRWVWEPGEEGRYSVNSTYCFLQVEGPDIDFISVWRAPTPSKHLCHDYCGIVFRLGTIYRSVTCF